MVSGALEVDELGAAYLSRKVVFFPERLDEFDGIIRAARIANTVLVDDRQHAAQQTFYDRALVFYDHI